MVSGELIRLKSLVDDCIRVARVIQREYPRLDLTEQKELAEYIKKAAPQIGALMSVPTEVSRS